MTKLLYLDNNVFAQDGSWLKIETLLGAHPELRVAVSQWLLIETANFKNRPRKLKRAAFIDSLNPAWLFDARIVQQRELAAFVYAGFFRKQAPSIESYSNMLSDVVYWFMPAALRPPITAVEYMNQIDAIDLTPLRDAAAESATALNTLKMADRKHIAQTEEPAFRAWIAQRLPAIDPDGQVIDTGRRQSILAWCWAERTRLYAACPAMDVEDQLFRVRRADPKRRAVDQDAYDLQHALIGLAYCDYFISRDGFVRTCGERVARKRAAVFGTLTALVTSSVLL